MTHDAAHILFSDGVVSCELNLLLPRMAITANLSFRKIGDAINAAWLFPKAMKGGGNPFKALWADSREAHWKREKSIQGFASEIMANTPAVAFLLETSPSLKRLMPLEVKSFIKLAAVVRCYQSAKMGRTSREHWDKCLREHGEAYAAAYGEDARFIPKHIWLRALSAQYERDGFTMDSLPAERKHALLKEAAAPVTNTSCYSKTVLSRALHMHDRALRGGWLRDGLESSDHSAELSEELGTPVAVSEEMKFGGTVLAAGDFITLKGRILKMTCCLCVGEAGLSKHAILAQPYRKTSQVGVSTSLPRGSHYRQSCLLQTELQLCLQCEPLGDEVDTPTAGGDFDIHLHRRWRYWSCILV